MTLPLQLFKQNFNLSIMAFPTDPKYKLVKDPIDGTINVVDLALNVVGVGTSFYFTKYSIPFVDDNTDYQEYKAWVGLGNTAEAAD